MKHIKISIIALAALSILAACKENGEQASQAASDTSAAQSESSSGATGAFLDDVKESARTIAKETLKELPYADQVQKVMDKVREIPASAGEITSGNFTVQKAEEIFKSLKEMPVADTPEDFQTAYNEVVKSYGEVCELAKKLPTKEALSDKKALASSIMSSLTSENSGDKITELTSEIKDTFNDLNASRSKLSEIAKKYLK